MPAEPKFEIYKDHAEKFRGFPWLVEFWLKVL